jgi:predicted KAP-like P-loop ATPase
LVVARSVSPPLAVGVFGDWGSGKTVFLRLLEKQVQLAAGRGDDLSHAAVQQVWFNAWHYAETDLWASLVAEIFSQLAAPSEE